MAISSLKFGGFNPSVARDQYQFMLAQKKELSANLNAQKLQASDVFSNAKPIAKGIYARPEAQDLASKKAFNPIFASPIVELQSIRSKFVASNNPTPIDEVGDVRPPKLAPIKDPQASDVFTGVRASNTRPPKLSPIVEPETGDTLTIAQPTKTEFYSTKTLYFGYGATGPLPSGPWADPVDIPGKSPADAKIATTRSLTVPQDLYPVDYAPVNILS